MGIEVLLQRMGVTYIVKRKHASDKTEVGLPNHEKNTKRAYIGFMPDTDVKSGDILTNPAGESVYVTETATDYFQKMPHQLKAYYQTEAERSPSEVMSNTIFNIQNAYGSIIGNDNVATVNYDATIKELKNQIASCDSPDKAELEKIISILEMIVENQIPPQKGILSKFSDVMERNSWITGSISSAIISWLTAAL